MSRTREPRFTAHPVTRQLLKFFRVPEGPALEELTRALDPIIGGSVRIPGALESAERRQKLETGGVLDMKPLQRAPHGTGARGMVRLAVEGFFAGRRAVAFVDPSQPIQCAHCAARFDGAVWAPGCYLRRCGKRPMAGHGSCEGWTIVLYGDALERATLAVTEEEARFIQGSGLEMAQLLRFLARPMTGDDAGQWARDFPGLRLPLSRAVSAARRAENGHGADKSAEVEPDARVRARAELEAFAARYEGALGLHAALESMRTALQ